MLLGLAGLIIVVSGDLGGTEAAARTYLLPTAGMLCLASGTVLARRLRPPEDLFQTIMMQSVVTAVLMMTAALLSGRAAPPADPDFWVAIGDAGGGVEPAHRHRQPRRVSRQGQGESGVLLDRP